MKKIKIALFFIFLSFFVSNCFCAIPDDNLPVVITSITPYKYFVEKLASGLVRVESIVSGQADPHHFEPTPKQLESLQRARAWIRIGEGFETKLLPLLRDKKSQIKIVEVWEGLPLLKQHAQWDRHIWLSPLLVKRQLASIATALIELCPSQKDLIQKRLEAFSEELDALDTSLKATLAPLKGKSFLVSHPSFAYFSRDYGLEQLSIEHEGKDPLPKEVIKILTLSKKRGVRCIISQPQFSDKSALLFAQKMEIPLYLMDPFAPDYVQNLLEFAHMLAKAHE